MCKSKYNRRVCFVVSMTHKYVCSYPDVYGEIDLCLLLLAVLSISFQGHYQCLVYNSLILAIGPK